MSQFKYHLRTLGWIIFSFINQNGGSTNRRYANTIREIRQHKILIKALGDTGINIQERKDPPLASAETPYLLE